MYVTTGKHAARSWSDIPMALPPRERCPREGAVGRVYKPTRSARHHQSRSEPDQAASSSAHAEASSSVESIPILRSSRDGSRDRVLLVAAGCPR